jgi:26S proteasome regulatory subunit N5
VEVERARLTYKLVQAKEATGQLEEACTLLLDLPVETFGSMELKEKVEYLLEQMRLTLARQDYVRTSIISKKISTRFFDKTDDEVCTVFIHRAPYTFFFRSNN